MADLLVGVLEGPARFNPDVLVDPALSAWPGSKWSPSSERLAPNSAGLLELHGQGQIVFVDFLSGAEGLGVDGGDDLAAAFLAWLTTQVDMRASQVVVSDWANDLVTLDSGMTPDELRRLRDA
ncbi:hypothetical protein [Isoptericola sp. NPDC019482]|uniref:hypothetical protein n=1 Tax=Isoptericola sp. NPDC019482 TaxID=3154688 RepID=UPI0034812BA0